MKLEEVLRYREGQCYIIEQTDSSIVINLGTRMKVFKDEYSPLHKNILLFLEGKLKWSTVFGKIKHSRDNDKWPDTDKNLSLKVRNIYIDGIKKD